MHKSVPAESQQKKSLPALWNPVMSGTFILPGNCWMWTASADEYFPEADRDEADRMIIDNQLNELRSLFDDNE